MLKSSIGKSILVLFLLALCGLRAQTTDIIRVKNKELDKLKKDIQSLQNELKNKSLKEMESLQTLENINKQNLLLSRLINNLLGEEKEKEQAIAETEAEINTISNRMANLKEQYSKYVVWIYKNRGLSMWRFIFNAESFNQAVKRYKYLQYISEENVRALKQLSDNKNTLDRLKASLEQERAEKENLANQKQDEQNSLKKREEDKKQLLTVLKRDKKMIANEISGKRKAEIEIKNIIAKLIEAERLKKTRAYENKAANKKYVQDFDYSGFENFGQLKGRLGWPVKEGRIVRDFGENRNEKLNTVTLNYGIDISVRNKKESVLAVAEGVVSAINWIPGYGSVIILTHRDEYRTVYGHVCNISVKEGERIKPGAFLGTVNESLEGNILHFEIWSERNYQNPQVWLARR